MVGDPYTTEIHALKTTCGLLLIAAGSSQEQVKHIKPGALAETVAISGKPDAFWQALLNKVSATSVHDVKISLMHIVLLSCAFYVYRVNFLLSDKRLPMPLTRNHYDNGKKSHHSYKII